MWRNISKIVFFILPILLSSFLTSCLVSKESDIDRSERSRPITQIDERVKVVFGTHESAQKQLEKLRDIHKKKPKRDSVNNPDLKKIERFEEQYYENVRSLIEKFDSYVKSVDKMKPVLNAAKNAIEKIKNTHSQVRLIHQKMAEKHEDESLPVDEFENYLQQLLNHDEEMSNELDRAEVQIQDLAGILTESEKIYSLLTTPDYHVFHEMVDVNSNSATALRYIIRNFGGSSSHEEDYLDLWLVTPDLEQESFHKAANVFSLNNLLIKAESKGPFGAKESIAPNLKIVKTPEEIVSKAKKFRKMENAELSKSIKLSVTAIKPNETFYCTVESMEIGTRPLKIFKRSKDQYEDTLNKDFEHELDGEIYKWEPYVDLVKIHEQ